MYLNFFQCLAREAKPEEIIIYGTQALQHILTDCKAGLIKIPTSHSRQKWHKVYR